MIAGCQQAENALDVLQTVPSLSDRRSVMVLIPVDSAAIRTILSRQQERRTMDRTEFFQAVTLFLVAFIAITTIDTTTAVGETIIVLVALPLLYLLPLYILVQLIRTARRNSWLTGRW
jgi:uncharacterized membrane protein YjjP (DUF1212 family)